VAQALANLVIAGVTKAGTTSLFAYLAQHPDVFAPAGKEVNYFSPLIYGRQPAGLERYAAHYEKAGPQPWRLDASPSYFVGGATVAHAVRDTLGRPRVLILLRNPVTRLWSSYTYKRSKGHLPREMDFSAFVDACCTHYRQGTDKRPENAHFLTLRTGMYSQFLGAWLETFGADLRVVFAEDLAASPRDVVRAVLRWLDVADEPLDTFDLARHNTTQQPRSVLVRRVGYGLNRVLSRVISDRSRLKSGLRSLYARTNTAPLAEVLTDRDRERVRAIYAPSVAECAALLRRHGYSGMPSWLDAAIGEDRRAP